MTALELSAESSNFERDAQRLSRQRLLNVTQPTAREAFLHKTQPIPSN